MQRNADGCQGCKIGRRRCDRSKPACQFCVRHNQVCDYNRIKFNTVNRPTNDKRTGRKPRVQMTSANSNSEALKVQKNDECLDMFANEPDQEFFRSSEGSQSSIEPAIVTIESSDQTPRTGSKSSNIHQLLWPQDVPPIKSQNDRFGGQATQDMQQHGSPVDDVLSLGASTPGTFPINTPVTEDVVVCVSAPCSAGDISASGNTKSEAPGDHNLPQIRGGFITFRACAGPGVSDMLKDNHVQLLLRHYIQKSVSTLHPHQAISDNFSARIFLPFCLQSTVAFECIMSFSASQLSIEDPRQLATFYDYKRRSLSSLAHLIITANSNKPQRRDPLLNVEFIGSVLSQISTAVSESGIHAWQFHCNTAYKILDMLHDQVLARLASPLEEYLYHRLLKYVCFAEIALPTTKFLDLSIIEGDSLDEDFAVPSLGLKLAVKISRHRHLQRSGLVIDLTGSRNEIQYLMAEYLSDEVNLALYRRSEWELIRSIWRWTIWLYHDRALNEVEVGDPRCSMIVSQIFVLLRQVSLQSMYGTALAFTILTVGPLLTLRQQCLRIWLSEFSKILARSTRTSNFLKIEEFLRLCWYEIDRGRCTTMSDVKDLAKSSGFIILAA